MTDARDTGLVRWIPRMLVMAAVALLASVPPTFAQSEGVTVDPDSPSGKEYDLPLERIRRQADPKRRGERVVQGSRSSPLFGEGIVNPGGNAAQLEAEPETPDEGQGGETSTADKGAGGTTAAPMPLPASVAASKPGAPDGGIATSIVVVGVGVLMIGVGMLGGLLLRRRSRPG